MKEKLLQKSILYGLLNCLIFTFISVSAQEMEKPIRGTILLSGNFGELRATHFHSGVDFRTGGREGSPVICVKDGVLVRLNISPVGYGNALYIEHADGTTSVYGHLQDFVPSVIKLARQLQYEQESFRIDEHIENGGLFFSQGDTIAYSGNSGSSGGPHLHFEVRNTETERVLNPLHYYKIRDTKAPIVRKLYLYTVSEDAYVECLRQCAVKNSAKGRYDAGRITVPAGKIGVGVFLTDYMNDSWNKLGVYKMSLRVEDDTLFSLNMDSCSFEQSKYINDIKDFDLYKKKETVYRCFGNYQDRVHGVSNKNKGYIELAQDSLVEVIIDMFDINGNHSCARVQLKGGSKKEGVAKTERILRYDEAHVLTLPDCRVELKKGSLFSSFRNCLKVEKDSLLDQAVFVLAEREIPLLEKVRLIVTGKFDSCSIICEISPSGKRYPVKTKYLPNALEAEVAYLSRYTIVEDKEAPEIRFLGKKSNHFLHFKIKDNLSGIARYRGEVNGNWCLFSYDAKNDLLQCSLSEPAFIRGKEHKVKILVEDAVGNKKELMIDVKK